MIYLQIQLRPSSVRGTYLSHNSCLSGFVQIVKWFLKWLKIISEVVSSPVWNVAFCQLLQANIFGFNHVLNINHGEDRTRRLLEFHKLLNWVENAQHANFGAYFHHFQFQYSISNIFRLVCRSFAMLEAFSKCGFLIINVSPLFVWWLPCWDLSVNSF